MHVLITLVLTLGRPVGVLLGDELPEVLEEEGRGRAVVLDGEGDLGARVPQDVDRFVVAHVRHRRVVDCGRK